MWFFVLVALALVFAIAAATVGREARRLDAVPPRAVFDPDEALEYVANRLPFEVAAELSYEDVGRILGWNIEYLRTRGLSANGSTPHLPTPVVILGSDTVAWVLRRAEQEGLALTAEQAHAVVEAQLAYLEAIGAVGPQAPEGASG